MCQHRPARAAVRRLRDRAARCHRVPHLRGGPQEAAERYGVLAEYALCRVRTSM
jgi:hypothetical protein